METITEVIKYRLSPNIFDLVVVEYPKTDLGQVRDKAIKKALRGRKVYPEPVAAEVDDDYVPQGPYDKWIPVDQVQMFQESTVCCITLKENPYEIIQARWSQADNWFSAFNSRKFWDREDILEVYLFNCPTDPGWVDTQVGMIALEEAILEADYWQQEKEVTKTIDALQTANYWLQNLYNEQAEDMFHLIGSLQDTVEDGDWNQYDLHNKLENLINDYVKEAV